LLRNAENFFTENADAYEFNTLDARDIEELRKVIV